MNRYSRKECKLKPQPDAPKRTRKGSDLGAGDLYERNLQVQVHCTTCNRPHWVSLLALTRRFPDENLGFRQYPYNDRMGNGHTCEDEVPVTTFKVQGEGRYVVWLCPHGYVRVAK